jgi:hypothetical protein
MTHEPVPTPEHIAPASLVEPSLADALAAIESGEALSPDTRRHWACSLRRIAEALDRPLALLPARWTALRIPVSRLHHAPLQLTAKTLANHKANLKAALRWYAGEAHVPVRGASLTPEWAQLRDAISDRGLKARLFGLMRYASAKAIPPHEVSAKTLAEYLAYRTRTTALRGGVAAERSIARSWNRCAAEIDTWPQQTLASSQAGPDWDAFPAGLRQDLEAYLASLGQTRRTANGKRLRPAKASTIRTRRAELVAFARKAVATGTPIDTLSSLSALLDPDLVERVLDAYWTENGASPNIYTIELAGKLLSVARQTGALDDLALERLCCTDEGSGRGYPNPVQG